MITNLQGGKLRISSIAMAGAASVLGFGTAVGAEDTPVADKSGYHLFNPTPRELMRPLSADRPDGTESPITVDAGHFQIETSFVDYVRDEDGDRFEAWNVFDTNLKVGLLNNVDFQLIFSAYTEEETDPAGGSREIVNGFGDITARLKINIWGNDAGETAFGVMPFVKIPTNTELSNEHGEGGFIAMFGWDVADNWGLGFMAEIDAVYDEDDDSYDTEFIHTAVVGFDIVDPVGAYVEYIGIVSTDADLDYQAILSTGLTVGVSEDVVFDVGAMVGLTDAADDLRLFAGMTLRY